MQQDTRFPNANKPEEAGPEGTPVPPAERRRRREVLNEQLRAIYDAYAASEVPQRLLDLASQFEEQARRRLEGGASKVPAKAHPDRDREDDA